MRDLTVIGARIRTLDPDRPWASAVAIRDGRSSPSAPTPRCGGGRAGAELIDRAGMAIVPGLTDSHMHPFLGALETRGADLAGAATVDRCATAGRRAPPLRRGCLDHRLPLEYRAFDGIERAASCSSRPWAATRR